MSSVSICLLILSICIDNLISACLNNFTALKLISEKPQTIYVCGWINGSGIMTEPYVTGSLHVRTNGEVTLGFCDDYSGYPISNISEVESKDTDGIVFSLKLLSSPRLTDVLYSEECIWCRVVVDGIQTNFCLTKTGDILRSYDKQINRLYLEHLYGKSPHIIWFVVIIIMIAILVMILTLLLYKCK